MLDVKAIRKDFGVESDRIEHSIHPVEKTASLSVAVGEIIPDGGPARVAYIFGYKSKRLIQVTVAWGRPANPKPDVEGIVATANILQRYFMERGFPRDKVMTNRRAEDGSVVVFQAADEQARTVLLKLNVPQRRSGEANEAPSDADEVWLRLSYIENATAPDIFRVKAGDF